MLSKLMEAETWMNSNKAIELGFADGILEKTETQAVPDDSYMFGAKEFEAKLVNKISKPLDEPKGRDIKTLKNELVKIKKYI
jgi:ATP-dependent Clp protease protease subunit